MITDCSDVVGGAFGGAPAGQRRREGVEKVGGLPGLFNDVERDFYAVISFKLKYKYNLGRSIMNKPVTGVRSRKNLLLSL